MTNRRKALRLHGRRVLIIDQYGNPKYWTTPRKAVRYAATKKVAFTMGECILSTVGFGDIPQLEVFEIMAIISPKNLYRFTKDPVITNAALFARDDHRCGYCGHRFAPSKLSRDHIIPQRAGGRDEWLNLITACKPCNHKKGSKMPGTRGSPHLIFEPRVPHPVEAFIASNPSISVLQLEYIQRFCKIRKIQQSRGQIS